MLSWLWSYGSWIYSYLCNQCLSSLTLWVQIPLRQGVLDTTLCDKVCQWLAAGQWFSLGNLLFPTYKTDRPPRYNWNIVESGIKHHNPTLPFKVYNIMSILVDGNLNINIIVIYVLWYLIKLLLALSVVGRGLEPLLGQTKGNKTFICCFSPRKGVGAKTGNQNKHVRMEWHVYQRIAALVSKHYEISVKRVVLVQSRYLHHLIEDNWLSP